MKYLLVFLFLVPYAHAWDYEGHKLIVNYVYYSTDMHLKNFNLTRMEEGAIAPDKVFRDQRKHHYPYTLELTKKWISNSSDPSYNFGVATHYISDSFASPHYIKNEKYSHHILFERQARSIYIECRDYNLLIEEELPKTPKYSNYWNKWLKSKDKNIPNRAINDAAKLALSAAIKEFNLTCNRNSKVEKFNYLNNQIVMKIIILFSLSSLTLYLFNR